MAVIAQLTELENSEPVRLAHDLNNDLAVIVGRCEILSELLVTNGDAAKHLQSIRDAADRMAGRIARRR